MALASASSAKSACRAGHKVRTGPALQQPRSHPLGAGEETLGADAAPSWVIKSDDINTVCRALYEVPGGLLVHESSTQRLNQFPL